jgi:tetratricopeptide (TPR) repeat protein
LSELGDFELAEKYARDCIEIAKLSNKTQFLLIEGISQLGYVMYMVGDVVQAEKLLEKSWKLEKKSAKKLGSAWKAHSLYTLGSCEIVMKNPAKAEAAFLEGIDIARSTGDREVESYCITDLGFVAYENSEYEKAKNLFEKGLKLGTDIDAQWTIAEALCGLGFVNAALGSYNNAKKQLQSSLKIFNETKSFTGSLLAIVGFAQILSKQNKNRDALQLIGLTRKYSTPIADTDHFADLILIDIKSKITQDVILKEIELGKKLDLENTIKKLIK